MLVTSSPNVLCKQSQKWVRRSRAKRQTLPSTAPRRSTRLPRKALRETFADSSDPPLRPCQRACLEECAKGARVIEMACGTGKTRVIKEWVCNISGRVLITVPLRALLEQFAEDVPDFCKVGTGYNKDINLTAQGFLTVTDSVHMLKWLEFDAIFVDEAHHPLPARFPKSQEVYRFSATHRDEPDFRYCMGQAIEDRVLCDYDLTVPVATPQHGHTYLSLADLLLKQAGRFRRVLAYCNSVREAKSFRMVLQKLGMAAWHMNSKTRTKKRQDILERFSGALQAPVNVLVTVEVLGEGINIPNADTCMFVEPRGSYRSIVQAIGRVLRPHPAKPLAHIILPAVALSPPSLNRDAHLEHEQPKPEGLPAFANDNVASLRPVGAKQSHAGLQAGDTRPVGNLEADDGKLESGAPQVFDGLDESEEDIRDIASRATLELRIANAISQFATRGSQALSAKAAVGRGNGSQVVVQGATRLSERVVAENGYDAAVQPAWSRQEPINCAGSAQAISAGAAVRQEEQRGSVESALRQPAVAGQRPAVQMPGMRRGKNFGSELQRFIAALAQADDRLLGLRSRVHIIICVSAEHVSMREVTRKIHAELASVLCSRDSWYARFRDLEHFVSKHGKLPSKRFTNPLEERSLSSWLCKQANHVRANRMLPHRLHRLLNASSPLVRRRVEVWVNPDKTFQQKCEELQAYILANGSLPPFSSCSKRHALASWLYTKACRASLPAKRRRMLEETHPLVKAKMRACAKKPLQINPNIWQRRCRELLEFIKQEGRLPTQFGHESGVYQWLQLQRLQFRYGLLPPAVASAH
ncbi:unnamed protein product [Effrenium voratum]|nr:unnamed protein product [Effrenium voratum]